MPMPLAVEGAKQGISPPLNLLTLEIGPTEQEPTNFVLHRIRQKDMMKVDLLGSTAVQLQKLMSDGKLSSLELVQQCHQQILDHNGRLNAVISISPLSYVEKVAKQLDKERSDGLLRGPLHGIPLIVKDALDTSDEFEVQSTNGGWAFEDSHPGKTAEVVQLACEAGMILMGKANLSARNLAIGSKVTVARSVLVITDGIRGSAIPGGWSARGGQTQSAYVRSGVIDDGIYGHSNPSGSSTGSAVAVSAGFSPVSIGGDFNGSLINPAKRAALYTLRTTPGTVSEIGGFPFAANRDSIGPMAKCTDDLIDMLNAIANFSQPRVPKLGYEKTRGREWKDISIATLDPRHWKLPADVQKPQPGALNQIIQETLSAYKIVGKVAKRLVGPVDLMSDSSLDENFADMMKTIVNDFSGLFDTYSAGLRSPKVRSLADLISFNEQHGDLELPSKYPNQDKLIESLEGANNLSGEEYERLDQKVTAAGGEHGIDKVLREYGVDVIIGPADSRLPDVTALARYPSVTLPLGYLEWNGRPFGLLAIASEYQEQLLLDVARAWEATFPSRRPPAI